MTSHPPYLCRSQPLIPSMGRDGSPSRPLTPLCREAVPTLPKDHPNTLSISARISDFGNGPRGEVTIDVNSEPSKPSSAFAARK